jgi:hypothetical protein
MYYEINVAKFNTFTHRHEHLFATAERSLTDRKSALALLKQFIPMFPKPEYNITIGKCEHTKTDYNVSAFLDEELNK